MSDTTLVSMVLTRHRFTEYGIFGELYDHVGNVFQTLEHSYLQPSGCGPKLPDGVYTCVRGTHQLHDGVRFETFEITGVKGHAGILFHKGNYNQDSDGCVLLGLGVEREMIIHSKDAFDQFMAGLSGIDTFSLTVNQV